MSSTRENAVIAMSALLVVIASLAVSGLLQATITAMG
jgi:hypothetical protein